MIGLPLQANHLGQRQFARLVKAAKVKAIAFHGIRHTCATLLLQAGEPVHVVSKRLGHARVEITPEHVRARARHTEAGCGHDEARSSTGVSRGFLLGSGGGVDDGVRTRDFRSHSPALYR